MSGLLNTLILEVMSLIVLVRSTSDIETLSCNLSDFVASQLRTFILYWELQSLLIYQLRANHMQNNGSTFRERGFLHQNMSPLKSFFIMIIHVEITLVQFFMQTILQNRLTLVVYQRRRYQ
jgi:hypothetical protein